MAPVGSFHIRPPPKMVLEWRRMTRWRKHHPTCNEILWPFGPEYPNVPYRVLRTDLVQRVAGHEDQITPPQPSDPPIGQTVLFPFTLEFPTRCCRSAAVVRPPDTTGRFDLIWVFGRGGQG